ncbi:hypothetical protein JCM8097_004726 [Rhodosporidiobolus ruineniae]
MAAPDDSLDSLPARVAALLDPQAGATPAQLALVRDEVVEVGRQLASMDEWTSAEHARKEITELPSWLREAFELNGLASGSVADSADVKPALSLEDAASLPATPAEEELANPFGGILSRRTSPRLKREASPSPQPPAKHEDPILPPRLVSFPNLFDLPLSRYPALPVPPELLDPTTRLPVFSVGLKRQTRDLLKKGLDKIGFPEWSEVPGIGCSPTFNVATRTLCLMSQRNMLPSGPGLPLVATMPAHYPEGFEANDVVPIFGGIGGLWYYYGDYVRVENVTVTGTDLASLDRDEYERWVLFSVRLESNIGDPETQLSSTALAKGRRVIEDAVAKGAETYKRFAVWRCVGFDAAKVQRFLRKRALRVKVESGMEVSQAEVARVKADALDAPEEDEPEQEQREKRATKKQRRK